MGDKDSIFQKFKLMVESQEVYFFDSHEYEDIIHHYIEKGEFEIAQKACDFGVGQYPYSANLLVQKSQLAILMDKVDESITEIHDFFENNGFDENLLFILASHYSQKGKLKQSLQCLDKVKELYHPSSELYYQYGISYFLAEDYSNAIENFKKSLKLDLENEDALYDLAFCLELEGKLEESVSFYQKFIDKDPYSCYAWYNLGVIHNKLKNYEEAINCFDYAYTIKEDFSSAYYNAGNSYVCIKEWDKAIGKFKACMKHENPSADLHAKIGECYEMKEDYLQSVEQYRRALDLDPEKESAMIGLGNVLHIQGKNKEAIHFIKKSLDANPGNDLGWVMLGKCEHDFGNNFGALEAFEQALEVNPKLVRAYQEYADYYFNEGQFEDAFDIVLLGLNELPDDDTLNYLAFVFALKSGKYKESIPYLENALFLAPENKEMVFEYFDDLESQKAILKLIEGLL